MNRETSIEVSTKHGQRVKRMLSKYGDLKPEVEIRAKPDHKESIEMKPMNATDEVDSNKTSVEEDFGFFNSVNPSPVTKSNPNSKAALVLTNSFHEKRLVAVPVKNYNRKFKAGFIWRWTGLKFQKKLNRQSAEDDHRPLFTYWLMLLQTILLIFSLLTDGIGDFGIYQRKVTQVVWHQSNSYQPAVYYEHPNPWLGPRTSVLIKNGATFRPCMGKVSMVVQSINQTRDEENQSGCCIRWRELDRPTCAQTLPATCSTRTSKFYKYSNKPGPVCGEDLRLCLDRRGRSFQAADVADWPNCRNYNRTVIESMKDIPHMNCEVTARPCCLGFGHCILATKEYCEFMKGSYNHKATLCSQVNCLNEACGLTRFSRHNPNQYYRLILSLLPHAGFFQYATFIFIEYIYMRRLENVLGTWKVLLIFFVAGVAGNVASTIFLPMIPLIGPWGSICGLISFLLFEFVYNRSYFLKPWKVFAKIFLILSILFLVSVFIPWVNFFANFFGFLYGLLTFFIILPGKTKSIGTSLEDRSKGKMPTIIKQLFSVTILVLITFLLIILYCHPRQIEPFLEYTKFFNCIPLTPRWCSSLDITYDKIRALN